MTNMHAQRSSSFSQRVLKQAFSQLGAKIGLIWVLLLVVLAVFSPLIANTIPLIALQKEEWVFPFMRYITVEDAFVFSSFLAILLLLFTPLRRSFSRFMVVLLAFLLVLALVINAWVKPPQLVIYDDFRAKEYLSQFDWVVHAPIPYSPRDYMRDVSTLPLEKPLADTTHTHWFGTEENGADVLSRMVHASRIALGIGFIATGIAMFIGTILGGLMGYFSGFIDMIGMRLVEVFESIPTLFLLLTFVAFFGPSIYFLMVIIGITSWSGYARYVRAEFLKLRKQEFDSVHTKKQYGCTIRALIFFIYKLKSNCTLKTGK